METCAVSESGVWLCGASETERLHVVLLPRLCTTSGSTLSGVGARASVCAVEEIAHFKNTDSNPAPFKPALSHKYLKPDHLSSSLTTAGSLRSGEAWRQIARRARRQVRCWRHNYLRPILTT